MNKLALTAVALLLSFTTNAAQLGDTLPLFSLEDADGNEHSLDDSVKRIYANADRTGDKLLKATMQERNQSTLDAQNAIVIGEISAAPGFVRRIIKGSLNDRSYTTWVDERGNTKKWLPYRDKKIAVIDLQQRKIIAIDYAANAEELAAFLDQKTTTLNPTASPAPSMPVPVSDSN